MKSHIGRSTPPLCFSQAEEQAELVADAVEVRHVRHGRGLKVFLDPAESSVWLKKVPIINRHNPEPSTLNLSPPIFL